MSTSRWSAGQNYSSNQITPNGGNHLQHMFQGFHHLSSLFCLVGLSNLLALPHGCAWFPATAQNPPPRSIHPDLPRGATWIHWSDVEREARDATPGNANGARSSCYYFTSDALVSNSFLLLLVRLLLLLAMHLFLIASCYY